MSIIPTILTDSIDTARQQLALIQATPKLSRVQFDVIDPDFIDEVTISCLDIASIEFRDIAVDIHLMVNEPIDYVEEAAGISGASMIIAQIERMHSVQDFITTIKQKNLKIGLSLDLHTPVEEVLPFLDAIDALQIMTVPLGKQGQPFAWDQALPKLQEAAKAIQAFGSGKNMELLVDGGINEETARLCLQAGATDLVVGSYLWTAPSFEDALEALSVPTLH